MSTILDALKKSEQERKLNKLPTLTDMAAPQEPSRWPLYIGSGLALLSIALVVLAYAIWDSDQLRGKPSAVAIDGAGTAADGPLSAEGWLFVGARRNSC